MTPVEQMLEHLPGDPLGQLRRVDRLWQTFSQGQRPIPQVVHLVPDPLGPVDWDLIICGGTLGILLGAALVQRGWRVVLLERGLLRGRDQEWNISRSELAVLLELGLLTPPELERAIASEFNPNRIHFHGGPDFWVRDVLNVGVDPVLLLETLKNRFLAQGGKLLEQTGFAQAEIHPDGVRVETTGQGLTARLMLDAMGHFSPVTTQARQGQTPDSVCLVVGTCAQGMPNQQTGDLLVSLTPIQRQCQYFWEAFPARDGRTTYLFTYLDAQPHRPTLETLFEDYFQLLPAYQNITLEQLQIQRALFGVFPCFRQSPLQTPWDRILPVGDSSGSQSPLSFGGFGAMIRQLQRLDAGIDAALKADTLSAKDLALLQPYQPNLAVTWLFQRAMSVRLDQKLEPNQINHLLTVVFQTMTQLGDPVLRPFLQDVVQFLPLTQTLWQVTLQHPGLTPKILAQVGPMALVDWLQHYFKLGLYSSLATLAPRFQPWLSQLPNQQQFYWQCWLDAWKYGSGGDYS